MVHKRIHQCMSSDAVQQQEDANFRLCKWTAAKHGIPPDRAENCDDGDVGCPDCPFSVQTQHAQKDMRVALISGALAKWKEDPGWSKP